MPNLVFSTQGAERARQYQEELNRKAEEGKRIYDDSNVSVQQLDRSTRRMLQRNETEQERYNRLMGEAKQLLDKNKISADDFAREVNKINQEVTDGTGRFKSFNQETDNAFGASAVAKVVAFGGSILSVSSAVQAVNDQLRANQELVNRAEASKLGVSETRNVVIRNLAGATQEEVARVLEQNQELAQSIRVSERFINLARAEALSASGGDITASLAATRIAGQFLRDRPGDIGGFAGSLLDLSKVTGTTDAMVNLGLLTQVGGLSRVVDPQMQAQNIPRSLIGQIAFGSTAPGAAALFAALSTGGGDIRGATSGTAAIALARQLREFEPTGGLGTTTERIRALQAAPDLARQFLEESSFEQVALGPIEQLLTDVTSEVARQFAANISRIPEQAGLRIAGQQQLAAFETNVLGPAFSRQQAFQTSVERFRVAEPGALSEEERTLLREMLQRTGETALGARAADFISGLSDTGRGLTLVGAIEALEARLREITTERVIAPGGMLQGLRQATELSDEERANASRLENLIATLKDINQQQLAAQQEMNRNLREAGLVGVPE